MYIKSLILGKNKANILVMNVEILDIVLLGAWTKDGLELGATNSTELGVNEDMLLGIDDGVELGIALGTVDSDLLGNKDCFWLGASNGTEFVIDESILPVLDIEDSRSGYRHAVSSTY